LPYLLIFLSTYKLFLSLLIIKLNYMKKIFTLIIVSLFFITAYPQNVQQDKEDFNKLKKKYDMAYAYLDSLDRDEAIHIPTIAQSEDTTDANPYKKGYNTYTSLANEFKAMSLSQSSYKYAAKYMLYCCYVDIAYICKHVQGMAFVPYADAKKYIMQANEMRPTQNSIPYTDAQKAGDSQPVWENTFDDQVFITESICLELRENDNILKYAKQYLEFIKKKYGDNAYHDLATDSLSRIQKNRMQFILDDITSTLKKKGMTNYTDELKYNMERLNFLSELYASNPSKYKSDTTGQNESDNPASFTTVKAIDKKLTELTDSANGLDPKGEAQMTISGYFLKLNRPVKAYDYFSSAAAISKPPMGDIWKYGDIASGWIQRDKDLTDKSKYNTDVSCLKKVCNVAENRSSEFTVPDWEKLKTYYDLMGDTERSASIAAKIKEMNDAAEKARIEEEKRRKKEQFKENFQVSFSTAPVLLAMYGKQKQIPICLDICTGRVMHGFRYDMYKGKQDKWHFNNWQEPVINTEKLPNIMTGFEASYTCKFFIEDNNHKWQLWEGPELRYASYTFDPISADVQLTTTTTSLGFKNIDAAVNRYEFCFNMGFAHLHSLFFLEFYYGLGIGYKSISITDADTNTNYNFTDYAIQDDRYSKKRWPKIYMPLRCGLHLGFAL
jgi:hypothetical protein